MVALKSVHDFGQQPLSAHAGNNIKHLEPEGGVSVCGLNRTPTQIKGSLGEPGGSPSIVPFFPNVGHTCERLTSSYYLTHSRLSSLPEIENTLI